MPDDQDQEDVPTLDYQRTCSRPSWADLPPEVRQAVAEAAGARVRHAEPPATSGFTGSFAAVLRLDDGRSVFAKAGSGVNPHVVEALTAEAAVLAALPPAVPAPRLVGAGALDADQADDQPWRVVVMEAVPGRLPVPWTPDLLEAVHTACLQVVEALTPVPAGLTAPPFADLAGRSSSVDWFARLDAGTVTATWGQPRWLRDRAADLDALARRAQAATAGPCGVHSDLRADNVLVDGVRAVLVDWNWLRTAAPWVDYVGVLPLARQDGVDVDAALRASPLVRDSAGPDPDDVDAFLAVIAGMMLDGAEDPLWPGGPASVRVHQRRYARTFLDWLAARRGWT